MSHSGMKIGVIGANGQLGQDIVRAFRAVGAAVIELNHDQVDVAQEVSVRAALQEVRPDVVVNTAAMHHLEACERDPEQAFRVNAVGALNAALACREVGSQLVHISTDYVFDGVKRSPYGESDVPLPLNVYGASKLAGEHLVRANLSGHCIVRVSAIYGKAPCRAKGGNNFVTTMLRLGRERPEVRVVDTEVVSPTYTVDIARQIVRLVKSDQRGLFHVASLGQCSWYRFAQEIFRLAGLPARLSIADPAEFPAKTPRPAYSVLDNQALRRADIDGMRPWQVSLREFLADFGALRSETQAK